jgi:hypothetical protein
MVHAVLDQRGRAAQAEEAPGEIEYAATVWEPRAVPEVVLQLGLASGLRPFFPRLQFFDAAEEPVDPAWAVHYAEVGPGYTGGTKTGVYGDEILSTRSAA